MDSELHAETYQVALVGSSDLVAVAGVRAIR